MKLKMNPGYRKQMEVNAYLNQKFMVFYDLVNDGLDEEVEKFFNDPEEYGGGNVLTELDEHIKKAFAKDDPHESIEDIIGGNGSYVAAVP
jgi:hypothetical protein